MHPNALRDYSLFQMRAQHVCRFARIYHPEYDRPSNFVFLHPYTTSSPVTARTRSTETVDAAAFFFTPKSPLRVSFTGNIHRHVSAVSAAASITRAESKLSAKSLATAVMLGQHTRRTRL